MKVALLAPFEERVPPPKYGGTERVVSCVAEELVALGHEVTLFATADSKTSAELRGCTTKPIRSNRRAHDRIYRSALNIQALSKAVTEIQSGDFDIIHNHFGWQTLLFEKLITTPIVTTIHGILDKTQEPTEYHMFKEFRKSNFISISKSQRRHLPELHFVATVYNGIRPSRFKFNETPEDYFAFLGRIHPQKGPEQAIAIAKKTGIKLVIAAKIDPNEKAYFKERIKPHIDGRQIIFLGEVGHNKKVRLLRNARALIAPIQWDEPFGITNIEAMACGTPVLTINRGSAPEILRDGKNGYLCKNATEIANRIKDIDSISRVACRDYVEKHFTARCMTEGYVKVYERISDRAHRAEVAAQKNGLSDRISRIVSARAASLSPK